MPLTRAPLHPPFGLGTGFGGDAGAHHRCARLGCGLCDGAVSSGSKLDAVLMQMEVAAC